MDQGFSPEPQTTYYVFTRPKVGLASNLPFDRLFYIHVAPNFLHWLAHPLSFYFVWFQSSQLHNKLIFQQKCATLTHYAPELAAYDSQSGALKGGPACAEVTIFAEFDTKGTCNFSKVRWNRFVRYKVHVGSIKHIDVPLPCCRLYWGLEHVKKVTYRSNILLQYKTSTASK